MQTETCVMKEVRKQTNKSLKCSTKVTIYHHRLTTVKKQI